MKLTDVSNTSIATSLRSIVIESEKKHPIINIIVILLGFAFCR